MDSKDSKIEQKKSVVQQFSGFRCKICSLFFNSDKKIIEHVKLTHINNKFYTPSKKYDCERCKKELASKFELDEHMKIHEDEKIYGCKFCPKSFFDESSLIHHNKTYCGNLPHLCEFCNKAFFSKSELNEHKYYHTDEKPFKCERCGYAFKNKRGLNYHLSHSKCVLNTVKNESGKYVCVRCKKENCSKINKIPIKFNKKKIYECCICSVSSKFYTEEHLNKHVNKFHNIQITKSNVSKFLCGVCHKYFASLKNLQEHGQNHIDSIIGQSNKVKFVLCNVNSRTLIPGISQVPFKRSSNDIVQLDPLNRETNNLDVDCVSSSMEISTQDPLEVTMDSLNPPIIDTNSSFTFHDNFLYINVKSEIDIVDEKPETSRLENVQIQPSNAQVNYNSNISNLINLEILPNIQIKKENLHDNPECNPSAEIIYNPEIKTENNI